MFSNDDPRLGQLLDGIVRLAAGELHARIEISEARDELDAVIMGTNLLAEDLQIIYQELEERVESRTADAQRGAQGAAADGAHGFADGPLTTARRWSAPSMQPSRKRPTAGCRRRCCCWTWTPSRASTIP